MCFGIFFYVFGLVVVCALGSVCVRVVDESTLSVIINFLGGVACAC
jgi:hypothetical protein